MSTAELRHVKAKIDTLTPARLRSAAELLDLLDARKSNRATVELLQIPGLAAGVRQGLKDVHAGRSTPIEKLRRRNLAGRIRQAERDFAAGKGIPWRTVRQDV